MATASTNSTVKCFTCGKEKALYACEGCSQKYCFQDLGAHRQENEQEFEKIITDCDVLQQKIIEKKVITSEHPLIQQIDQWEINSIEKIKQTAAECREELTKSIRDVIIATEKKLNKFINQARKIRQDNDFNEIHLNELKNILKNLNKELLRLRNISLTEEPTSFIKKNSIIINTQRSNLVGLNIRQNARWSKYGTTVAGGNEEGNGTTQLSLPEGLFVDDDQTLIIADTYNHRIIQWKKDDANGQVITGGKGEGNKLNSPTDVLVDKETDSLIIADRENRRVVRWPRHIGTTQSEVLIENIKCWGLALDDQRYLYVSDIEKHEVRRYELDGDKNGIIVAGGNDVGGALDQLNFPTYLFVDQQQNIYVSDNANHRVMKWTKGAKEGIVVAGGNGMGNALTQLFGPSGIFIDSLGTLYIADSANHRVLRWPQGVRQGTVLVGGIGQGKGGNRFHYLRGLSFDRHGNLYVVDKSNHRVQRFSIE